MIIDKSKKYNVQITNVKHTDNTETQIDKQVLSGKELSSAFALFLTSKYFVGFTINKNKVRFKYNNIEHKEYGSTELLISEVKDECKQS